MTQHTATISTARLLLLGSGRNGQTTLYLCHKHIQLLWQCDTAPHHSTACSLLFATHEGIYCLCHNYILLAIFTVWQIWVPHSLSAITHGLRDV